MSDIHLYSVLPVSKNTVFLQKANVLPPLECENTQTDRISSTVGRSSQKYFVCMLFLLFQKEVLIKSAHATVPSELA